MLPVVHVETLGILHALVGVPTLDFAPIIFICLFCYYSSVVMYVTFRNLRAL